MVYLLGRSGKKGSRERIVLYKGDGHHSKNKHKHNKQNVERTSAVNMVKHEHGGGGRMLRKFMVAWHLV